MRPTESNLLLLVWPFLNSGTRPRQLQFASCKHHNRLATAQSRQDLLHVGYTYAHEIDNVSGFRQRYQCSSLNPNLLRASGDRLCATASRFAAADGIAFDHAWSSGPKRLTQGWSLFPSSRADGIPWIFSCESAIRIDTAPKDLQGSAILYRARKCGGPTNTFDPAHWAHFRWGNPEILFHR